MILAPATQSQPSVTTAQMMAAIQAMDPDAKKELDAFLLAGNAPIWVPQDGPQLMAYLSKADIVFYGGAAGGGKTDLLLGLCLTSQEHSIIFRREAVQLTGIEERMTKILGTRKGYNSQDGVWRLPEGKVMELGSVKEPGDWIKYQGRPHDAKCVGLGTPARRVRRQMTFTLSEEVAGAGRPAMFTLTLRPVTVTLVGLAVTRPELSDWYWMT